MRVTHIITRLILGGAQENTVSSVLGLREKPDLELSLISGPTEGPEGTLEPLFAQCPEVLRILPSLIRPIRPWTDWRALGELTRMLAAEKPDLVHTHSGKAGVIGRLAAARAGVPLLVHTSHGPSFGSFQGPLANFVFRAAEVRAAKVTTHFVVVADAMKDQYLQAGIGRPDQYTRVLSGFVLEPFLNATNDSALRLKFGLKPEDIVIGKIARLVELKGHSELLAIARALVDACPRIKFLLVGDGHWRSRFEAQAKARGLENHFRFTGLVPPGNVPNLLGIMDLLIHLSEREGLARALPQALAAGRPVVAYDRHGAREVCRTGETGCLVRPGDLEGLKAGVLSLANNPAERERLGRNGRELVRKNFSVQQMVDDLHDLYLRLIKTSLY